MLPSPSRLKSLASEFSPVLTTPPPVEPKTVFVLMSVPEMMLSSNFVALRRRAAMIAAIPASTAPAPATIAQAGKLPKKSSKNPGGSFAGALAIAGDAVFASGALTGSWAFACSGALAASPALPGAPGFGGSGGGGGGG